MSETEQRLPLIVIVHGSKSKTSSVRLINAFMERFYAHFGIDVEEDRWIEPLRKSLEQIPAETLLFDWSGGISLLAVRKAARELTKLLELHRDQDLVLFGKSLGGTIALSVARNTTLPIRLVACIAAPHSRFVRAPAGVNVVNIYSDADNYLRLAHHVLYLGFGSCELRGAQNIDIPKVRHSGFNHDIPIELFGRNMSMFAFYRELLTLQ